MKNNFGVIDIGSNSVRMVIYDLSVPVPAQTYNQKVFCALGRDLATTGKLNPEGAEAAAAGLHDYARHAEELGLDHLDIVGTAALRDAIDGLQFIERIKQDTGLNIRLITGDEEARYAALGVLSLDPEADGIVGDFGGGSLEFARIQDGDIRATISQPYGAFRVLSMGDDAKQIIQSGFTAMASVYGDTAALYAIGGSWRALAQSYMIEAGQDEELQGYAIPYNEIVPFCQKLKNQAPDDIARSYRIEDKRAALAPVSAFVLEQVMVGLTPRQIVISKAGIRDGIVYDFNNQ